MNAIPAVYENGLFRPIDPVRLAEGTRVSVVVQPAGNPPAEPEQEPTPAQVEARRQVYEILSRRYSSGHHDTAERHNEHQP